MGAPNPVPARLGPNFAALRLHLAGWVNAMSAGAKGDGSTDDTAALAAAVAAAERAAIATVDNGQGEGGKVLLPRGVYKITSQLALASDGLVLEGEGANATAILVDIASNPTTTDAIRIGDGTGAGRRVTLRNLSIYTDTNFGTNKVRDLIYIDGASWWRLENVHLRNAGRYGLRVGGTLHGCGINVRAAYCGDSGIAIENSSTNVEATTVDLYHPYCQNNWKHGIHVRQGTNVNLFGPILEYNGENADPTAANGLRMGDTGITANSKVNVFGPYFESNQGWDIHTGTGLVSGSHQINVYGGLAASQGSRPKTTAYGFFYGDHARGTILGIDLEGYTVALNGGATYSLDSTCKVTILGQHGDIGNSNLPAYRTGAVGLNDYAGGLVQWVDVNGLPQLFGRYAVRAGYFGSGGASVPLYARGGAPDSGTFASGDYVFNRAPTNYRCAGWVNVSGGSPGTWRALPVNWGHLSSDRGDADVTLTVNGGGQPPFQLFASALTQNRTVTLDTTGAAAGDMWRIVRTGLGAFTLDVGGLKTIPSATAAFVDVAYSGSAWVLVGYGTL